ncbi:MAG TPA: hypothetical protein VHD69_02025 [Candidatus Paceibacterota bacterium]|nr:hypothetical protein [Candidatus Paceibacterota bacterium]
MLNEKAVKNPPKKKDNLPVDPLENIGLSAEQIKEVVQASGTNLIVKIIPALDKFLGWIDYADQKIREQKLNNLLNVFISKFESTDKALKQIGELFRNRAGIILFQKIIQIIDNSSADDEWLNILANVLKNISNDDFVKHFEAKDYVLAQISKLTPQALIIINKHDIWKQAHIQNTTTTSGQTASGDWSEQITMFLRSKVGITDLHTGARINHSFRELESAGLIKLTGHELKFTAIGLEIRNLTQ